MKNFAPEVVANVNTYCDEIMRKQENDESCHILRKSNKETKLYSGSWDYSRSKCISRIAYSSSLVQKT